MGPKKARRYLVNLQTAVGLLYTVMADARRVSWSELEPVEPWIHHCIGLDLLKLLPRPCDKRLSVSVSPTSEPISQEPHVHTSRNFLRKLRLWRPVTLLSYRRNV